MSRPPARPPGGRGRAPWRARSRRPGRTPGGGRRRRGRRPGTAGRPAARRPGSGSGSGLAAPAGPAEHRPAQDRQVVAGLDLGQALRAVRARPDDALLPGDPVDADVQEAADDRADDEQPRRHRSGGSARGSSSIRPRRVARPGVQDRVGHPVGRPVDGRRPRRRPPRGRAGSGPGGPRRSRPGSRRGSRPGRSSSPRRDDRSRRPGCRRRPSARRRSRTRGGPGGCDSSKIAPPPVATTPPGQPVGQVGDDLGLAIAEGGLAVLGEDRPDRPAGPGLDLAVDVGEGERPSRSARTRATVDLPVAR